jgi:hypothetical protein
LEGYVIWRVAFEMGDVFETSGVFEMEHFSPVELLGMGRKAARTILAAFILFDLTEAPKTCAALDRLTQ